MSIPMTILAAKRKRLYAMIYTYNQRRAELKGKFKVTKETKFDETVLKHRRHVNNMTLKIRQWNREVRRIDETRVKIERLIRKVNIFCQVSIENKLGRWQPEDIVTAKHLYYKFGLESGITGQHLMDMIGVNWKTGQAAKYRKDFTKTLSTNPDNKQLWLNFCTYYIEGKRVLKENQYLYINKFKNTK